jgi:hypothetical protein
MTGVVLALAGLACADGGPGTWGGTASVAVSRWQTDFRAFCAHEDEARRRGADLGKLYENKPITWRLKFQGLPTYWRGPGDSSLLLLFDIEKPPAVDRYICSALAATAIGGTSGRGRS